MIARYRLSQIFIDKTFDFSLRPRKVLFPMFLIPTTPQIVQKDSDWHSFPLDEDLLDAMAWALRGLEGKE